MRSLVGVGLSLALFYLFAPSSSATAQTPEPNSAGNCVTNGYYLEGGFDRQLPDHGVVQFADERAGWKQWLFLPAENPWMRSGSGSSVAMGFLGKHNGPPGRSNPVPCVLIPSADSNALDVGGSGCSNGFTVVDNGPIAALREVYVDKSKLQAILTVRDSKWGASGINEINDHLVVVLDGKIIRKMPVRGFEPQTLSVELTIPAAGHHVIVFGTTGVTNAAVCL